MRVGEAHKQRSREERGERREREGQTFMTSFSVSTIPSYKFFRCEFPPLRASSAGTLLMAMSSTSTTSSSCIRRRKWKAVSSIPSRVKGTRDPHPLRTSGSQSAWHFPHPYGSWSSRSPSRQGQEDTFPKTKEPNQRKKDDPRCHLQSSLKEQQEASRVSPSAWTLVQQRWYSTSGSSP